MYKKIESIYTSDLGAISIVDWDLISTINLISDIRVMEIIHQHNVIKENQESYTTSAEATSNGHTTQQKRRVVVQILRHFNSNKVFYNKFCKVIHVVLCNRTARVCYNFFLFFSMGYFPNLGAIISLEYFNKKLLFKGQKLMYVF